MKKILILVVGLLLTVTLAGCTKEVEVPVIEYVDRDVEVIVEVPAELPVIPAVVDMSNIDDFLGRPDVQYIDLRNFDDKMNSGYISGFEMIPFFTFLEDTNLLVRNTGWDFTSADIVNEAALRALFNEDKTVFLMCGSGTRAGYVMAALEELGYTDVLNVGGIGVYTGANLVAGDGSYNLEVQLPLPAVVDMTNIDMYLGRSDVQYVDLRNFDDKMNSGYIAGFEFIPFFDYLESTDILVRNTGWTFTADDILSQGALRALFTEDKTVFLMCGSGTRAGYVMAALEELGYTNVLNIGGIGSYTGANLVSGDGTYLNEVSTLGVYTPGVYLGYDPIGGYNATVTIGQGGGIVNVFFDAASGDSTKQDLGFDYNMKLYGGATYEWFEHANMLGDFIVANQGWDGIALDESVIDPLTNATTVGHHFIYIDNANSPDAIAGVTIGAEGFVLAWNDAIMQATEAGTEGMVATTATPADWAMAHAPAFEYVDGTYFGLDEAHGYYVSVTVEGSVITDVFFDAIYTTTLGCATVVEGAQVVDEEVTDEDLCLAAGGVLVYNDSTTKQVLGFDYNMKLYSGGDYEWFEMANMLSAAIIDVQEWSADWIITLGGEGEHDHFDGTVDAVAGVTIGIEGFLTAFEEAMAQAVPVS